MRLWYFFSLSVFCFLCPSSVHPPFLLFSELILSVPLFYRPNQPVQNLEGSFSIPIIRFSGSLWTLSRFQFGKFSFRIETLRLKIFFYGLQMITTLLRRWLSARTGPKCSPETVSMTISATALTERMSPVFFFGILVIKLISL